MSNLLSTNEDTTPHPVDNDSVNTDDQKKIIHKRWTQAVRQYVGGSLFRFVQFVNRDTDIDFGSSIQKAVCTQCNIPTGDQQEYWNDCGCDEVLEVLRRKRQAVATSLKARFGSEYKYMEISVLCRML
jgi:hypothetical protein